MYDVKSDLCTVYFNMLYCELYDVFFVFLSLYDVIFKVRYRHVCVKVSLSSTEPRAESSCVPNRARLDPHSKGHF